MSNTLKSLKTILNQIPNDLLNETGEQISVLSYNLAVDLEYLIEEMREINE